MPQPLPQTFRDSLNILMYETTHLITLASPKLMVIILMVPDPVYMTK